MGVVRLCGPVRIDVAKVVNYWVIDCVDHGLDWLWEGFHRAGVGLYR